MIYLHRVQQSMSGKYRIVNPKRKEKLATAVDKRSRKQEEYEKLRDEFERLEVYQKHNIIQC